MTVECNKCSMKEECICIPSSDECSIRKQSYNIAIVDFVEKCRENWLSQVTGLHIRNIEKIAEEMKKGEIK